ncbi:Glycoside hydrolase OS=Streptomyces antimycoticus OX=68175 GN=SANT12839_010750 PE=3 SV=1 [Streptomyces antimycoticus]
MTTESGEDWFLHFQDRDAHGRVVHLQPMRWRTDGWPVMGTDDGSGRGAPVLVHTKPRVVGRTEVTAPASSDDFSGAELGRQWMWQANADPAWWSLRHSPGRLALVCQPSPVADDLRLLPPVLTQRLPAESFTATTSMSVSAMTAGSRAGLVVLGESYAWVGLRHDGDRIVRVCRTAAQDAAEVDVVTPVPLRRGLSAVRLRVTVRPGAVCQFAAEVDGRGFTPLGRRSRRPRASGSGRPWDSSPPVRRPAAGAEWRSSTGSGSD